MFELTQNIWSVFAQLVLYVVYYLYMFVYSLNISITSKLENYRPY